MIENFIKPTHALLVTERQGSYFKPLLNVYCKSIVCLSKIDERTCNVCENCKKIDNNFYFDLIIMKSPISKENILEIQNRFLHMGLEKGNHKIYVIEQIENAHNNAINSLLKFLEEPPHNTYAILTTRNESKVPETISSRCQRFLSPRVSNFNWEDVSKKYNLEKKDVSILTNLYWTIDDILFSLENNEYVEIMNLSKKFLNEKKTLIELKELSEKFKKLSYSEIELILNYCLFNLTFNGKKQILEIVEILNLNPIKTAIFWKLIESIKGNVKYE